MLNTGQHFAIKTFWLLNDCHMTDDTIKYYKTFFINHQRDEGLGFGFDCHNGKCTLVYCDKCNGDQLDIIVIATPFIVMCVSYIAVFIKLQRNHDEDDITTKQYKVSTFVLTFCYAVLIIPNAILSWISPEVKKVSGPS